MKIKLPFISSPQAIRADHQLTKPGPVAKKKLPFDLLINDIIFYQSLTKKKTLNM
jgi:hypothetical protein